jgi:hypothetical protein
MKDLTDADLKAIWVYLKSLPPVKNPVPLPVLPQRLQPRPPLSNPRAKVVASQTASKPLRFFEDAVAAMVTIVPEEYVNRRHSWRLCALLFGA